MKLFEDVIRYERLKADKCYGEVLRFTVISNGREVFSGVDPEPYEVLTAAAGNTPDYIGIEIVSRVSTPHEKVVGWQKFYDLKAFQDTYC